MLIGIPGEAFTGIGLALKETAGWNMILPTCLTNGSQDYIPMMSAYEEGGYESRTSIFKAGVAELLIQEGRNLMSEIAEN